VTRTLRVEAVPGNRHRRLIDGVLFVRASKLGWWEKSIRRRKAGKSYGKSLTGERGRRQVTHGRRRYVAVEDGSVYVQARRNERGAVEAAEGGDDAKA